MNSFEIFAVVYLLLLVSFVALDVWVVIRSRSEYNAFLVQAVAALTAVITIMLIVAGTFVYAVNAADNFFDGFAGTSVTESGS